MAIKIEVRGDWGGAVASGWRPAVTGTLNTSGESDDHASTFETRGEALSFYVTYIRPELTGLGDPEFRLRGAGVCEPLGEAWTWGGYWAVVLGANRTAATLVHEFDLIGGSVRDLNEWLGTAESTAWEAGGFGGTPYPEEWSDFHRRALDLICRAVEEEDDVSGRCDVRSSVSGRRCVLATGHGPDDATRYHRFTEPR